MTKKGKDIKALTTYYDRVLSKKISVAKNNHSRAPSEATMAAVNSCHEEEQWLKILAMWVGRLGNTKGVSRGYILYAKAFITNSRLYDDQLWHNAGSFKHTRNATGPTKALRWFEQVTMFLIICIEVYGLVRGLMRTSSTVEDQYTTSSSSGSSSNF